MAKTLFVNGNPAQGILGTVVTAEFLNAVNKHHHTGRDVDGEGALPYAADTGAADAYAIALDPALDTYITGMPIFFKAANANTGASTLDINGLGVRSIKKSIDADLAPGDILKDQIIVVVYDGTNFQMPVAVPAIATVRDQYRNLVIRNNATNPTYQADIAADEVVLKNSAGNARLVTSLSQTVDITASGVNGVDAGSEASSVWYHIWAIAKEDGTTACILSTSTTVPTMPSGYTYQAYLGAIYNNASGDFITMMQKGDKATRTELAVLTNGTQTSWSAISLAAAVPTTAKAVLGYMMMNPYTSQNSFLEIAANTEGLGYSYLKEYDDASYDTSHFDILLVETQTIYYKHSVTESNLVSITGWTF